MCNTFNGDTDAWRIKRWVVGLRHYAYNYLAVVVWIVLQNQENRERKVELCVKTKEITEIVGSKTVVS